MFNESGKDIGGAYDNDLELSKDDIYDRDYDPVQDLGTDASAGRKTSINSAIDVINDISVDADIDDSQGADSDLTDGKGANGENTDSEGADGEGADGEGADGEGADGKGAEGEGAAIEGDSSSEDEHDDWSGSDRESIAASNITDEAGGRRGQRSFSTVRSRSPSRGHRGF